MARSWESDAIKEAGKKWQEANSRGDKAGMDAAHKEADRLRAESGYSTDGGKSSGNVNVTDHNSYTNSGAKERYERAEHGLGGGNKAGRPAGSSSRYPKEIEEEYYNPYEDLLKEQQERYEAMLRAQEEANRRAVEQGVSRLESNRGTINQGYDEAARQAYIAKMQQQKALPQQLAGQGILGGATESAQIALDTSYGNNINSNEQSRQNALTGLDQSISDLRNSGDLSLVEQQLALQQQQLSDYQNVYAQKIAQDNWLKQWQQGQQNQELQNYYNTIGAYSDDYTAEINRLLAAGYGEDSYQVKALKQARAEKIAAQQAAQQDAEQTAWERWLKEQQLANQTAKTNYQIRKPYYRSSGGSNSRGKNVYGDDEILDLLAQESEPLRRKGNKTATLQRSPTAQAASLTQYGGGILESSAKEIMRRYQQGLITEAQARTYLDALGIPYQ